MTDEEEIIKRAPLRRLMGVQVLSTGSYVPDNVVRNEDLQTQLGFDPSWIVQRTGIRERRFAPPEMATSDLGIIAAQRCIDRIGAKVSDIDLVLCGTFTPDMSFPSTACLIQDKLGIRAPAVDLQAACAGFMYALVTGMQFVATGCSKLALIVGADCNSRILNPKDQRTYPLFGDGAGAVLLAAGTQNQGFVSYTLGADGSGGNLLSRPLCGSRLPPTAALLQEDLQYLQMDGKAVFKWAVRLLDETIRDVLQDAKMTVDDLNLLVMHQANIRIINAAVDVLGIQRSKMLVNLDRYGNTSAGSVPLALDEAFDENRVHRGDNILLSGFGAGLAWGTGIFRW
jgi:3-oxoacyl-[acyl-carrier-protein] synthase-3